MTTMLALADLEIEVLRKNIKNVHLSVLPPKGRVRIAAPERTSLETLRLFAISKLAWIRQEQEKLRRQERESPRVARAPEDSQPTTRAARALAILRPPAEKKKSQSQEKQKILSLVTWLVYHLAGFF